MWPRALQLSGAVGEPSHASHESHEKPRVSQAATLDPWSLERSSHDQPPVEEQAFVSPLRWSLLRQAAARGDEAWAVRRLLAYVGPQPSEGPMGGLLLVRVGVGDLDPKRHCYRISLHETNVSRGYRICQQLFSVGSSVCSCRRTSDDWGAREGLVWPKKARKLASKLCWEHTEYRVCDIRT